MTHTRRRDHETNELQALRRGVWAIEFETVNITLLSPDIEVETHPQMSDILIVTGMIYVTRDDVLNNPG